VRSCTPDEIRAAIFEVLCAIAPEIDPPGIKPDAPLREQIDLDSFDFLNVIIALNERLSIAVPETDYGQLGTLDSMVDYLARRCAAAAANRSAESEHRSPDSARSTARPAT
jgi:acyl carrier protein